jgi:hypothetical protein
MRVSSFTVALGTLTVAAAWAAAGAAGDGGPSPGIVTGWDGVAAPTAPLRYVALPSGRRTVVAAVRTRGGRVVRYRTLAGSYGVPLVAFDGSAGGLAHDGRTLVLATYAGPTPQKATHFAVLDVRRLRLQQTVTLRGAWSYDAISPDGSILYLIQYLPGQSLRYRVRAYDLATDRLIPQPIVDKREPGPMVGTPVTRATSADGTWAYTLYASDGDHPFIHALDTRRRLAVCIDLEWHGSQNPLWRMRLAPSADGRKLELRRASGRMEMIVDAPA